jgi:hypothetical protein
LEANEAVILEANEAVVFEVRTHCRLIVAPSKDVAARRRARHAQGLGDER